MCSSIRVACTIYTKNCTADSTQHNYLCQISRESDDFCNYYHETDGQIRIQNTKPKW